MGNEAAAQRPQLFVSTFYRLFCVLPISSATSCPSSQHWIPLAAGNGRHAHTPFTPLPCSCCIMCGQVLEDIHFSSDVQFVKGVDGESEALGNLVTDAGIPRGLGRTAGGTRLYGYGVDSQERTLMKSRGEIANLVDRVGVRPRDETVEATFRLYQIAMQRNFTRGRRANQVGPSSPPCSLGREAQPVCLCVPTDGRSTAPAGDGGLRLHRLPPGQQAVHAHRLFRPAPGQCVRTRQGKRRFRVWCGSLP